MLNRKTQYVWMATGGLICLFGLILACKLRDGNKAIAQVDKPPVLLLGAVEDKPTPPPPSKETKSTNGSFMPFLSKLQPAKTDKTKPDTPKPKAAPEAVLPMPLSMTPPPPPPSNTKGDFGTAPSFTPLAPPPALPPSGGALLPASFDANTATPKSKKPEAKDGPLSFTNPNGGKGPAKTEKPSKTPPPKESDSSAPLRFNQSKNVDKKPSLPLSAPPPAPPVTKETSSGLPSWSNPEGKVAPTSYAPVTAAAPSTGQGGDREGKTQPGEPPLAPAPGPVQMYHVHGAETLQDIARRTLGSSDRWSDLHKLNPTLKPDTPLSAGTAVRLPGDACVQADEAEPVKALPALRPKPTPPKAKALPLTGTYQCSLDDKNQLTLPRAIRDQFGGSETVLVSPGPDKCLWLTNQPHLERLGERLEQSQANEADVRVFKRLYFAQTEKLPVNTDGRVGIPDRLASFAGLHQELVLVGIDDHFEVWDAARWRQYTQQKGTAGRSTASAEQD
jgi:MraZ protein